MAADWPISAQEAAARMFTQALPFAHKQQCHQHSAPKTPQNNFQSVVNGKKIGDKYQNIQHKQQHPNKQQNFVAVQPTNDKLHYSSDKYLDYTSNSQNVPYNFQNLSISSTSTDYSSLSDFKSFDSDNESQEQSKNNLNLVTPTTNTNSQKNFDDGFKPVVRSENINLCNVYFVGDKQNKNVNCNGTNLPVNNQNLDENELNLIAVNGEIVSTQIVNTNQNNDSEPSFTASILHNKNTNIKDQNVFGNILDVTKAKANDVCSWQNDSALKNIKIDNNRINEKSKMKYKFQNSEKLRQDLNEALKNMNQLCQNTIENCQNENSEQTDQICQNLSQICQNINEVHVNANANCQPLNVNWQNNAICQQGYQNRKSDYENLNFQNETVNNGWNGWLPCFETVRKDNNNVEEILIGVDSEVHINYHYYNYNFRFTGKFCPFLV